MRRMGPICALAAIACASEPQQSTELQHGWADLRPLGGGGGELPIMPGVAFAGWPYEWVGPLAPGSGTFSDAPLWDWTSSDTPSAFGGGLFDVTVDGVTYSASAAESFSAIFDDGAGAEYLLLGDVVFETDASGAEIARVLYVVTPRSDFVVGAAVAIDGGERQALFAAGRTDAEYPEVVAAAASGTITFVAGGLGPGETVSASMSGDFGLIDWEERPPDDPPPDTPPPTVAPGAYRLAIGALAEVRCDGTLAGREADYGTIGAADVGFADGDVSLSGSLVVDGAALASGFGTTSVGLDWDGTSYSTFVDRAASGPFGVDQTFAAIAVLPGDGALEAMVAALYDDRVSPGGWCAVTWTASLTP